jgi:hypothetical protein
MSGTVSPLAVIRASCLPITGPSGRLLGPGPVMRWCADRRLGRLGLPAAVRHAVAVAVGVRLPVLRGLRAGVRGG